MVSLRGRCLLVMTCSCGAKAAIVTTGSPAMYVPGTANSSPWHHTRTLSASTCDHAHTLTLSACSWHPACIETHQSLSRLCMFLVVPPPAPAAMYTLAPSAPTCGYAHTYRQYQMLFLPTLLSRALPPHQPPTPAPPVVSTHNQHLCNHVCTHTQHSQPLAQPNTRSLPLPAAGTATATTHTLTILAIYVIMHTLTVSTKDADA